MPKKLLTKFISIQDKNSLESEDDHITQGNLQIQCNLNLNTNGISSSIHSLRTQYIFHSQNISQPGITFLFIFNFFYFNFLKYIILFFVLLRPPLQTSNKVQIPLNYPYFSLKGRYGIRSQILFLWYNISDTAALFKNQGYKDNLLSL